MRSLRYMQHTVGVTIEVSISGYRSVYQWRKRREASMLRPLA
jgi:hypothetical protein